MSNALVPEFSVSDWRASKSFYCKSLGFLCLYERPEEGFCYLKLGDAELMIDQIGVARIFGDDHLPKSYPFGKGMNVQIRVPSIEALLQSLMQDDIALFHPLEDRWYCMGEVEVGHRQIVVADPDGYLLRFYEDLGQRTLSQKIWEPMTFPTSPSNPGG